MTTIRTYVDSVEAHLACGALGQAGVSAHVVGPEKGQPFYRLVVADADAVGAAQVLAEIEGPAKLASKSACPRCQSARIRRLPPYVLAAKCLSVAVIPALVWYLGIFWTAAFALSSGVILDQLGRRVPGWRCQNCQNEWATT